MTGELIELFIVMWVVATLAFAPLGYFIYKYTTEKNAKPFGDTEPHGDSPSLVNTFAELALNKIQQIMGKK